MRPDPIRSAIREKYRTVAACAEGHFPYPVGRASALGLGYRPEWIAAAPHGVVDRFVGVGNPFAIRLPAPGERVLDLGCGCGLDLCVAAALVGPAGCAVGVDLTRPMLEAARRAIAPPPLLSEADACRLPFRSGVFDRVLSNGVLNLVADKDSAFREIHRVLRPGGTLAAVDLLVVETVPDHLLANMDAWSS